MKISLANFRAIKNATIYLEKKNISMQGKQFPVRCTLVAGKNHTGKTSIAQAVAAALTGEPKIYPQILKKNIELLVRYGEKQAMIKISDDLEEKYSVTTLWPDCKMESTGDPLSASRIAVGLESLATMNQKDLMKYFSEHLNAAPTKEELITPLKTMKLNDMEIDDIWATIESLGWDAAYDDRVSKGRALKTQWQNITGEQRYGSKKGGSWLPLKWDPELMTADEDVLKRNISDAREWYEAALKGTALSETQYLELKDLANNVETQKAVVDEAKQAKEEKKKELNGYIAELREIDFTKNILQCPACNAFLIHETPEKLAVIQDDDKKKQDELQKKYDKLQKKINDTRELYEAAIRNVQGNENLLNECMNAQASVKTFEEAVDKDNKSLEEARESLEKAKERYDSFVAKREADKLHNDITLEVGIVNTLSPEGLRKEKLFKAVGKVNDALAKICDKAGWGKVFFDENLNLNYRNVEKFDIPFFLCSESEQYRIRATLQIFVAIREKAPVVLFDRFDLLDNKGRNDLMGYAVKTGMPTIIFVTTDDEAMVNKTRRLGANVYWLDEGVSREVK